MNKTTIISKQSNISVFVLLLGLLFMAPTVKAQQNSEYTQYMYNTIAINPAYAGSRESLSMLGIYRNQWVGLEGAPETLNFSAHSSVGVKGVGIGLGFTSDKLGPSEESVISADFSYTIKVGYDLNLALGVKGGISLWNFNPNKLNIYDPNDVTLNQENYSSPIIGAGVYLYSEKWYVGLSSPNFVETTHYDDIQASTFTEKAHLYLIGGYIYNVNPRLKLKPAFLIKSVMGSPLALDLSLNALINEGLTLGLSYRLDAAVSVLAGFQVSRSIMIGYTYDYDTTELGNYNDGSHEILLRFELGTRRRGIVNPRFF
ncbi:type IX secretion system membrane protein PorP/SprF [Formosa sediminum]|uniref:Type IX secretion system membrane protein PorP/SprF n=1 Tax=Formosa sediminum TaxID=2594004 RepID=A0A516GP27_9FLAO|nr:type IX secretion system membrane protein PorP/SprF [Formosa sediminum]QDO93278.1 type IX secretion system membrane protein PorP/SprF [Formosa sediminum]